MAIVVAAGTRVADRADCNRSANLVRVTRYFVRIKLHLNGKKMRPGRQSVWLDKHELPGSDGNLHYRTFAPKAEGRIVNASTTRQCKA